MPLKLLQESGNVPGNIELDDFPDVDIVVHEELTHEDIIKSVREPEKLSDGEDHSAQDTPALVA